MLFSLLSEKKKYASVQKFMVYLIFIKNIFKRSLLMSSESFRNHSYVLLELMIFLDIIINLENGYADLWKLFNYFKKESNLL